MCIKFNNLFSLVFLIIVFFNFLVRRGICTAIFRCHEFLLRALTQPFYMRFCNGVGENFELDFVINIGYYITEAGMTNITTLQKYS